MRTFCQLSLSLLVLHTSVSTSRARKTLTPGGVCSTQGILAEDVPGKRCWEANTVGAEGFGMDFEECDGAWEGLGVFCSWWNSDKESNKVQDVPVFVHPEITYINLRKNAIKELAPGDFAVVGDHLVSLNVNMNEIPTLASGFCDGLNALKFLSLHANQINPIEDGALVGCPLEILILSNNKLDALTNRTFAGLTSLWKLNLYGNKIGVLPAHVFDDLISLEWLDLMFNPGKGGERVGSMAGLGGSGALRMESPDIFNHLGNLSKFKADIQFSKTGNARAACQYHLDRGADFAYTAMCVQGREMKGEKLYAWVSALVGLAFGAVLGGFIYSTTELKTGEVIYGTALDLWDIFTDIGILAYFIPRDDYDRLMEDAGYNPAAIRKTAIATTALGIFFFLLRLIPAKVTRVAFGALKALAEDIPQLVLAIIFFDTYSKLEVDFDTKVVPFVSIIASIISILAALTNVGSGLKESE